MKVILRADASAAIGTGHFMRSLTLAAACAPHADVVLATHAPVALLDHARRRGVAVVPIARPHPDPADVSETTRLIPAAGDCWVVADGYHFDAAFYHACRDAGARVMAIDDSVRLPCYDVDALLDQNLGAARNSYVAAPATRLLLGPTFSLLRPEFARTRLRETPAADARRLLLTFGGSDPGRLTFQVLAALKNVPGRFSTTVLVGAANPNRRELDEIARSMTDVQILIDPADLPAVMANADLAISAYGGTLWELACIGVPTLVISSGDQLYYMAKMLDAYGSHRWLGDAEPLEHGEIVEALTTLAADAPGRAIMRRLGQALVDGEGATRVSDALLREPGEWGVRPARHGDAEPIWEIMSDPSVRQQSFQPEEFAFPSHERWFRQRLARVKSHFWVIERDATVGGMIRYDHQPSGVFINFAVATPLRRRGLGTRLLADTWASACRLFNVDRVRGVVLRGNEPSCRAFLRAGFVEVAPEMHQGRPCHVFERTVADAS